MGNIDQAVQALVQARQNQGRTPALELPNEAAAEAVQAGVARTMGWFEQDEKAGQAARHWKSGGASRQDVLSHAPLPPAGVRNSPVDASGWHLGLRGIEAEIALRIGRDVAPAQAATLDHHGAALLVDAMCVSIELIDSRWREGLQAPALARLADLQSHGALVLGEWQPFAARDWAAQRCRVSIGARPPLEFQGTHSLGDPAFVLPAWLRRATQDGAAVRAGTVVTTGNWCGLLFADAGDRVEVEFHGIGRAEIQL